MERRNFIKLSAATAVTAASVQRTIAAEKDIKKPGRAPKPDKKSDFSYVVRPGSQPDTSIVPLGNATGRIMAFELIAGLPIIFDLRSHMQSTSVIAGDSDFVFDYTSEKGETLTELHKFDSTNYQRTLTHTDGIQPIVSYKLGEKSKTCWSMDLKNHDREWIEESNVLKTVMRNADIELTCIDFADTTNDMIVRRTSVKNISDAKLSNVKLFQYAPVNPSGRRSTAGFEKDWFVIKPTNYSYYDKTEDCLLFSDGDKKWWMMGSDQKSIAHDCNIYPLTRERINNDALAKSNSSDQGLVDAALCYGDVALANGKTYAVDFFIGYANNTDREGALRAFKTTHKNLSGKKRVEGTLRFWKNWHAKGKIPATPNTKLNTYIKTELMLIKTQEFWTGGFPSDAFELSQYYYRDTARPALALAQFGYPEEAKNNMLVLAAITSRRGYCNAHVGVEQWIKDITVKGLPSDVVFPETGHYSADDPPVCLTFIGKIYQETKDKEFARKIWPLIPYTIEIARRDIGVKGTVAQVYGFQDDMIHWAQQRPLVPKPQAGKPAEKGVECSYWNMFWVAGIEHAAQIATDLGHDEKAKEYTIFAKQLRDNIEKHLWDEKQQCYAYYYDPKTDKLEFLNTEHYQRRAHGAPIAIQSGYLKPDHPHALGEWMFMRDGYEKAIPFKDPTIAKYSVSGQAIGRYLFAKVHSKEANTHEYLNWYLNVMPFAGISEYLPYHFRIQVWTRGEVLMGIHEYLKMYYPQKIRGVA
jgi:hypothetical protein